MPSPERRAAGALLAKDLAELAAAPSTWILLAAAGPLVGHAYGATAAAFAEASGVGGGAAALAQGLSPLDGLVAPTFGAYDLVATFLLPFVVIRSLAAERQSGAWKLLAQGPVGIAAQLAIKAAALLAVWALALLPGLLALALWRVGGGHLDFAETATVILGHLLRAAVATGVAAAASGFAVNAASAAIVTLAFTIGTWALDYAALGRGGLWATLAGATPSGALHVFERGLLSGRAAGALAIAAAAGWALAAIGLDEGAAPRRRAARVGATLAACAALAALLPPATASRDLAEDRRNSFPPADEVALRSLTGPLVVTVHLAPEDPRLADFESSVLAKLRRTVPGLRVEYAAQGRSGLFVGPGSEPSYGEIEYRLGERRATSRSTIDRVALDEIYRLARVVPPPIAPADYPGYPLRALPPTGGVLFFVLWPIAVLVGFLAIERPWR